MSNEVGMKQKYTILELDDLANENDNGIVIVAVPEITWVI